MKTICGMRPTGNLHIGHYFACIAPALSGADLLIATYHAPFCSRDILCKVSKILDKFNITSCIYQDDVFNATVYFNLLSLAHMGELNRMTQFQTSADPNPHLFSYPVLMAHDITGYDEVIVGDDQTQHIRYAGTLIDRFNKKTGSTFPIPTAKYSAGRIMSFTDSSKKMSKSDPNGCLFLDDTPDVIAYKIRKAITDENGRNNLYNLYLKLGGTGEIPELNSYLKNLLTERVVDLLK